MVKDLNIWKIRLKKDNNLTQKVLNHVVVFFWFMCTDHRNLPIRDLEPSHNL